MNDTYSVTIMTHLLLSVIVRLEMASICSITYVTIVSSRLIAFSGHSALVLSLYVLAQGVHNPRHGVHLSTEQCPKTIQEVGDMRRIPYASTVGSLMYVMLYTRPDICYAVEIVSRKSTSRSVFTLNEGSVVWRSIKQGCIADSTMEAKFVAACEAAKEAVWLRKFRNDLKVVPNMNLPIILYCDNSGAIANSKEPRNHKQEKHIERKYNLIREIV
ncbi:gag/pol protein [Cucumis melo var. makuwa]|uniref:Gag/pol protein n=1 Tax=Cucumis melo var. makuwa TaxID=1194695 RepID=A0A5D3D5A5_CUCMM|nr:gag/pol protein [Cucumis melo var. makuwa]